MLKEHDLRSPGANRDRKRIGRGVGSGYGKTAGRGTKGQKSRTGGSIPRYFQGGQNPIHKQLPYKRGFTNNFRVEYNTVNLDQLEAFDTGTEVTVALLFERRVVRRKKLGVKVLGDGELTKALTVQAHRVSATARAKIEAAGGRVDLIEALAADEATAEA
ncbi:MAG: 50S ribosomal protein L15 [Chloroflexi bacterium]|nr:50S ribosomal protein L15 [Chloroflexota bacterium]